MLRAFNSDDAKYLCEMKENFVFTKAFGGRPFPNNIEGEQEWISRMYPAGLLTSIIFVIEEIESKTFMGYISATKIDYINSNAQVGIIFHKNSRGKEYFIEASVLFYAYLFNEINLHKIYSGVLIYNETVLEKNKKMGFTIDGVMKDQIFQSGRFHDVFIISLTAKDFFEKNGDVFKSIVYIGI